MPYDPSNTVLMVMAMQRDFCDLSVLGRMLTSDEFLAEVG